MKPCEAFLQGLFWHWLLAGLLTPSPSKPLCGGSLSLIPPGCFFLKQCLLRTCSQVMPFKPNCCSLGTEELCNAELIPSSAYLYGIFFICAAVLDQICWFAPFQRLLTKEPTYNIIAWKRREPIIDSSLSRDGQEISFRHYAHTVHVHTLWRGWSFNSKQMSNLPGCLGNRGLGWGGGARLGGSRGRLGSWRTGARKNMWRTIRIVLNSIEE